MEPDLISKSEAALMAGVSERTINRWSRVGDIRVWRPWGPWGPARYDAKEVEARAQKGARLVQLLELPSVTESSPDSDQDKD